MADRGCYRFWKSNGGLFGGSSKSSNVCKPVRFENANVKAKEQVGNVFSRLWSKGESHFQRRSFADSGRRCAVKTSEMLAALVVDSDAAMCNPQIARAVLNRKKCFKDSFTQELVSWLRISGGSWRWALSALPLSFQYQHAERIKKFKAWAEKITRRQVRGLLEWKGGAL